MSPQTLDESVRPSRIAEVDQLEASLQRQLRGRIRGLKLALLDDGLVLRGSADTFYAKQLAQHGVMQATDLPILANHIDVS